MDDHAPRLSSTSSSGEDLAAVAEELRKARQVWRLAHRRNRELGGCGFPSRDAIDGIVANVIRALFPMRLGPGDLLPDDEERYVIGLLGQATADLRDQVRIELAYASSLGGANAADGEDRADAIVREFVNALPSIRTQLDSDVEAAYFGDPAAQSVDEVLICYPGIVAIAHYRLAHRLHRLGVRLVARIISEIAHARTGIDIHPGASIGSSFFIDHGTGVVIGETCIIGDRVRLYQAVTLGARSFPTDENGLLTKGLARHPIIEDDVVVYAGATILGRVTIGRGARIGGNVWLTEDVLPDTIVNQAPIRQETTSRPRRIERQIRSETDSP